MTSNDEKLRYTTMFSLIAIASVLLVTNPSLAHASLIGGTCSENQEICKVATIVEEETEDGIIVVGEDIIWNFQIFAVNTSSETWVDVKIKDRFGGDLAVGDSPVTEFLTKDTQVDTMSLTNLDCELTQKGKTQKEFLDCIVDSSETEDQIDPEGDLFFAPGETASVSVLAETDFNHGQGKKDPTGKREYTSCGVHEINSGATLSGVTEFGESVSVSTSSITVGVFDLADLSGDCDEDGFTDGEELNIYGTDPFNPNDQPTCNGINTIDICIDGDGIASSAAGSFSAVWGMSLNTWPTGGFNEGIDWFDFDANDAWTAGGLNDAIHLEDGNGSCGTGIRDGSHQLGQDCIVLDLGANLAAQHVDCDLETGTFCGPTKITYLTTNGIKFLEGEVSSDGFYNNGEDIIIDVNGDGIFN